MGGESFSDCGLLVTCLLVELSWNSESLSLSYFKVLNLKLSIKKTKHL